MSASTDRAEDRRTKCPECGEMSLQSVGGRGEDDYGQLEGDRDFCEKCGYDTGWQIGRC